MQRRNHALYLVLLIAVLLVAPACSSDQATPTADSSASIAGRYRLRGLGYEDASEAPEADYYLVLNDDNTAQFEEQKIGTSGIEVIARGTWERAETGVTLTLTELFGESVENPEVLKYEYVDGFPTVTEYAAGDQLFNVEEAKYTIGSGERHPLVNELHQRLAKIDYLDFTDPGDDLYTEETRKAVVQFQQAQGLIPNGVVDATTWVLLGNPPPPVPTPSPWPTPVPSLEPTLAPTTEAAPAPTAEAGPPAAPPSTGAPDLSKLSTHTEEGKPIVYFTFDDGPSGFTQQIMDLFAQYDGQATFFVLGNQVQANRELTRAEAQAGHYIANHTNTHTSLSGVTPEQFMNEVETTRQIILETAGDLFTLDKDVKYLRPPYGATDQNTLSYADALGYAVVLWDIDPQDWRRPGADVIANHIISSVYPGAIVLSHDGGGDRTQTVEAYRTVLAQLSSQGYVFRNIFVGP
jgi:peptidoglycan/xylan/chitin deacetylase (PgdA/CDA1 family)